MLDNTKLNRHKNISTMPALLQVVRYDL